MHWFKQWLGFEDPGVPEIQIEHRHALIDPIDRTEVTVLVHVRFRDGRETERRDTIQRNQIEILTQDLIDDVDIREAAVYEEVSYHHKSYSGDRDARLISSGVIIGAVASGARG